MTSLRLTFIVNVLLVAVSAVANDAANTVPNPAVTKATVEINGKPVFPSNGTVAGVWFFHDSELGDA